MKENLKTALLAALDRAQVAGQLPQVAAPEFVIEKTKKPEHGDLAANLAMQLARPCGMAPRQIAQVLMDQLGDAQGLIAKAEIAGPGFLNFFINPAAWLAVFRQVCADGAQFGRLTLGANKKVMVEFVSANPTGPLHVGHGRGACLGDTLARLLRAAGFAVETEYYINDAGNQMHTLGRSVLVRARQIKGSGEEFPENHYRGEYITDMAREYLETPEGQAVLDMPAEKAVPTAAKWAGDQILQGIKDDLADFKVSHDLYFSEQSLVDNGAVERAFAELEKRGHLYEKDGALWFRSTDFGDDKDRVIRRSNGETTYFASDIAYHLDKYARGFQWVVNVWGADHHGYVPRMKAAVQALGRDPEDLTIVLVQLVNLLKGGQPVSMSTRAGQFDTLRQVIDEVGADAARFIFLTRKSDAPLDFDLEAAKQKSMDNPVYYVQYAHTRTKALERKAAEAGVALPDFAACDLAPLSEEEELKLARQLNHFPEVVAAAAQSLEPHRVTYYLQELAQAYHSYYNTHRVMGEDPALTAARLVLNRAVGQVLANGLGLLGVEAPESM